MITITWVTAAILCFLCLPSGYLLAVTAASWRFRKQVAAGGAPLHLGVLIPAHNEEAGMALTVQNVFKSDYPPESITVMVVADNCTDATAGEARSAGAMVFERRDPERPGKGQALDWFLSGFKEYYSHLDGIVIIDADARLDQRFLKEISASLSRPGVEVVQGYNGVGNPGANWRTGLCDAAFNVFNHLRMAGAAHLSGSAVLKGLGMGFSTPVLIRYGWPAHSVVEDQEFTLTLLDDGIRVHYNPDAVIRSEMVTRGDRAAAQRSRWEGGRLALAVKTAPVLFRRWATGHDPRLFFALCELTLPPLSLVVAATGTATVMAALWLPGWMWLAGVHWAVLAGYVVSGQIQRRATLSTWLYLAAAPLFVVWKLILYAKMASGHQKVRWTRTVRETEASKDGVQ